MKKIITTFVLVASLAFSIVPAFAAASHTGHKAHSKPTAHRKIVSAVCPVMKTKISDVRKSAGKSVYKGKTYYFCCPECKPKFDKNPAKYVK